MYKYVYDPIDGESHQVNSKKGLEIINAYNELIGGDIIPETVKLADPELFYHNPMSFADTQFKNLGIVDSYKYKDMLAQIQISDIEKQKLYENFVNGEAETREYYNNFIKVSDNSKTFNQLDHELGLNLQTQNNSTEFTGGGEIRFTKSTLYKNFTSIQKYKALPESERGQFGGDMSEEEVQDQINQIITKNCSVFSINGNELDGDEIMICMEAYSPDTPKEKKDELLVELNGKIDCLKDPTVTNKIRNLESDEDYVDDREDILQTCIERKKHSTNIVTSLQKSMISNLETFLNNDQRDSIESSTVDEIEKATSIEDHQDDKAGLYARVASTISGVRIVTSGVLSTVSSVGGVIAKGGAYIGLWIVSNPRAAKITLFIARRVLRDMCHQVHRKINEAKYSYANNGAERPVPRAGFGDIPGIKQLTQNGGELAKVAAFEGARDAITANFDTIWDVSSGMIAGATVGFIGSLPGGGLITGAAKGLNSVMKESCKFGAEVAMFEADMSGATGNLMDIICDILPGAGGRCWNIDPQAGGGDHIQILHRKLDYQIMDL